MANKIQVKRSAVANKVPTTADLDLGEIAINTNDGKMYIKKDNGTASIVQVGYATGDVVGPASATDNAVARFDATTGKLIQNSVVTIDDSGNASGILSEQWNIASTPPAIVAGLEAWDDGNGTLEVGLKGGNVSYKYGQQEYVRAYNGSGSAMTKGQAVYIYGAQGNRVDVRLAQANLESTSAGTIGIVAESIANGAEGWVQTSGTMPKLNTNGLTAGATIFVSTETAGSYTTTRPTAPNHAVVLGWVERVDSNVGSIYIKVDNGYELDELHNVLISGAASGNTLIYDAVAGVWENANLTPGTGITITGGAGSITIANSGVTSVTGTAPVVSSGGATPAISLAANYGDTLNPYASKTAKYFLAAPNAAAGVPTFRAIVASDIPTLNQSTTGSAATLTTTRTLWGQNFNGSANVTGAMSSVTTLAMSGQLTNTVAVGTAPMVITSTTRVANLNVATAGTADVGTAVTATTSTTSSAFKVPFLNTTASTTGNYGLLQDSTATFTYNPSTNTLAVGTVSGSLSGNATTATSATTASSASALLFNGGSQSVPTSPSNLPALTTAMALVINNTSSQSANFEAVVKQITSTDASIAITETSPGVWDLSAGAPPSGGGWYTVQSSSLSNLATTIDLPAAFTTSPTSPGSMFMGASSTMGGSMWGLGLNSPAWSTSTSYGGWSSPNQPYKSDYNNWGLVTDPATIWSSAPSGGGFVFNYMQYAPQSSNVSLFDVMGNTGNWSSQYGSGYSYYSPFNTGTTRVFYAVLVITGSVTVTANPSLNGTTVDTAYDSWSNTTYVFFKCDDNTSVGDILMGLSTLSWGLAYSYYGHSWYEYS